MLLPWYGEIKIFINSRANFNIGHVLLFSVICYSLY